MTGATYSTVEVANAVGASYRQVDYWLRRGYIAKGPGSLGSGNPRRLTLAHALQAGALAEFRRAGVRLDEVGTVDVRRLLTGKPVTLGAVTLQFDREHFVRTLTQKLEAAHEY